MIPDSTHISVPDVAAVTAPAASGAPEAQATAPHARRLVSPVFHFTAPDPALAGIPGIVVLDTCVLLSNVLRRVFLRLADHGCFLPVWSRRIGREWCRNAARIWGVPDRDIEAQWSELQTAFPLACQGDVSAFEAGLQRSDPKDWHVIAAGRAAKGRHPGRTAAIVTRNTRDFNRTELRGYGMSLHEPDELLVRFYKAFPDLMAGILAQVPEMAAAPGREPGTLDAILRRERLFRLNRLHGGES